MTEIQTDLPNAVPLSTGIDVVAPRPGRTESSGGSGSRAIGFPAGRILLGVIGLLFLAAGVRAVDVGKEPPAGEAKPAVVTPVGPVESPASLADLLGAASRLESLRQEVESLLVADGAELRALDSIADAERRIPERVTRARDLPLDDLLERQRRGAALERWVDAVGATITTRLRRIDGGVEEIAKLRARLDELAVLAEGETVPASIRARVSAGQADCDALLVRLGGRRVQVLENLDRVAALGSRASALRSEAESRLGMIELNLDNQTSDEIWRLSADPRELIDKGGERFRRDLRRARAFLVREGLRLGFVGLGVFVGVLFLSLRLQSAAARLAAVDSTIVATLRVFQSPIASASIVTVVAMSSVSTSTPLFLRDVAMMVVAVPAAVIAIRVVGRSIARLVVILAGALVLAPLAGFMEVLPLTERLFLLLQVVPVGVALALDLKARPWTGLVPPRVERVVTAWAWGVIAALGMSVAGVLFGRVDLAKLLRSGALGTLGGAILAGTSYLVVAGLWSAIVASRRAQVFRMVAGHHDRVASFGRRVLRWLAVAMALWTALVSFRVESVLARGLAAVVQARFTLGSFSISVGAVLSFAAILGGAFLLSRLVAFFLEVEILSRFELGRGVAIAVSLSTRYLILVAGFVVATAASGVDFGKVGFLAGALGVGIGFGLQNVVNNFVSGLILLFERPVHVGDAVDLSGTSGRITRIGIRSSTVHTFAGAEVIVPNADLISKPVTNWTLTDPNRRFDLVVGVAYGSSMEATARALLAAAERVAGIRPEPAPEALLQGFGESSLNWVLRVWTRFDESPQVMSALQQAVSEELGRAGIGIPFPQREVLIRAAAPGNDPGTPPAPRP